jgi:hypothetical protein
VALYKSPTCGCCEKYVDYLRRHGFEVKAVSIVEVDAIKDRLGVPNALRSCHTAVVGDYLVEGHVPVSALDRLLKERPRVRGLAVPSMPPGSPGMESPRPQPYAVLTFDGQGRTTIYERHPAAQ